MLKQIAFVQVYMVSSRVWKIHSVTEANSGAYWGLVKSKDISWFRARSISRISFHLPQDYEIVETAQFTEPAHVLYTVLPIDLSAGDIQAMNADSTHVPKPILRPSAKWSFQVPLTSSLR